MSTVDEVLATAEVVDAICVIDGETRIISVPNEYNLVWNLMKMSQE